jgi:hypothetical protein
MYELLQREQVRRSDRHATAACDTPASVLPSNRNCIHPPASHACVSRPPRLQTRQYKGLELIASENFTSRAVIETLGTWSVLPLLHSAARVM